KSPSFIKHLYHRLDRMDTAIPPPVRGPRCTGMWSAFALSIPSPREAATLILACAYIYCTGGPEGLCDDEFKTSVSDYRSSGGRVAPGIVNLRVVLHWSG